MAKKQPPKQESKAQAAPKFRPLASQLEELARKAKEEARAKEAAEKAAREAAIKAAKQQKKAPPPPPKPAAPAARPSTLTKEERAELEALERSHQQDEFFFRRLMSGVTPLNDDKHGRIGTAPKLPKREPQPAVQEKDPDDAVRDHLMNLVEGGARFEVSDDGKRLEGRRLDLDQGTFRRLRRGELSIDARLDLHGRRADEARDALEKFLDERRIKRDRVVLVIHGRGEHSPAGLGVLRGEISAWLSQGRASRHVAAFASALQEDGGEGALYVLLRP